MKIITVEEWENGYKIEQDTFYPVYLNKFIKYFLGKRTGVRLSREFCEILEISKGFCSSCGNWN